MGSSVSVDEPASTTYPASGISTDITDKKILRARQREAIRLASLANRSKTILTSRSGTAGQATLGVPTLLGTSA